MNDDTIGVSILNGTFLEIDCNIDQAYELKEHFSCYAPDYQNDPKFKYGGWDGKISFFDLKKQTLPIGLMKFLKPFLKKYDYTVKFYFSFDVLTNDIDREDLVSFYDVLFDGVTNDEGHPIYPRDYQQDAIYTALKYKRCVLESPTGSGKSLALYAIIRFIMEDTEGRVLLVVPSINLVKQMFSDFGDYGWDATRDEVSLLYGDTKFYNPDAKLLISTWQSLYKKPTEFFEEFQAVLVDETHGAQAQSIRTILMKCENADYKIGVTGTLPDEKAHKYNIYGYLGPLRYKLKSKTLIDRGFLSNIKIVNLILRYPQRFVDHCVGMGYSEEVDAIMRIQKRNRALKYIISHIKPNDNTLILTHRLTHIDSIVEYVKEKFPEREVLVISGKVKSDERERIRKYVESASGVILVATYGTVSTGVNIPKLHHVIFASFYKSKIKVLQSIGRGLRKHKTKTIVIIWDIVDDLRKKKANGRWLSNFAWTHFIKRTKYYKDQQFEYVNKRVKLNKLPR